MQYNVYVSCFHITKIVLVPVEVITFVVGTQ